MQLTCYAEARDGRWIAQCLDFDLAVQGSSFEDVKARLEGTVGLYLERVRELPPEEQKRLLERRAPFWAELGMILKVIFSGVIRPRLRGHRDGGAPHSYNFPIDSPA